MGRKDYEAKVVLDGDAKGASKAIKETESGFKRLTSGIRKSAVAQVAAITGSILAVKSLVGAIGSVIKASQDQEDAVKRLEVATDKLGAAGAGTAESVKRFAEELQKVSTVGDDAAISTGAFLLQMGVAPGQINQAIQASADLAASLGIDLQSAARNVGKTVGGFAGELGEVIPELKGLSAEALQAGEGIAFLADKFAGAAAANAETFAGRIKQLQNSFTDLQQGVGDTLTQNEEVARSLQGMTSAVEAATPGVAALAAGFINLGASYIEFLRSAGEGIVNLRLWAEGSRDLDGRNRDTEASTRALKNTADNLGISVADLNARIGYNIAQHKALDGTTAKTTAALDAEAAAASAAAAAHAALEAKTKATSDSMEKLAAALGLTTSAQLQKEIDAIETALEAVRVTTGGVGLEFEHMEAVAADKIDSLMARAQSLISGVGDIGETVKNASTEMALFGETTDDTASSMVEMAVTVDSARAELQAVNSSLTNARTGLGQTANSARLTAAAFDRLAASAGRAAAVSAALSGGGTLSQGGTRVRLPGGGSRLVNTSGTNSSSTSNYSLSPFGTGGKYSVDADGSLRPT